MFLNYFYLIACSRRIANNTSVLVFNLMKENRNWNSVMVFTLPADFILANKEFEKKAPFGWYVCLSIKTAVVSVIKHINKF